MAAAVHAAAAALERVRALALGVQLIYERALAAVDLHALIVAASGGQARDAECGGRAVAHLGHGVGEVVHQNAPEAASVERAALMDERAQMAADRRVFRAGDEAHQIEAVAAQIAQRAGAGDRLIEAPHQRAVDKRQTPRLAVLHIDVIDPADQSAPHQIAGIARGGLEAIGEADHVLHALFQREGGQRVGLFAIHADGLFEAEGLAGLGGGHGDFKVDVVGRGNIHRVHIGAVDQIVIIGKAVRVVYAISVFGVFDRLGAQIAHGDQLQIGTGLNARQVNPAGNAAYADAANANH